MFSTLYIVFNPSQAYWEVGNENPRVNEGKQTKIDPPKITQTNQTNKATKPNPNQRTKNNQPTKENQLKQIKNNNKIK